MDEIDLSVGNAVLDEKIPDIDVPRSLSSRLAAVSFHFHGTCVVLVKLTIIHRITLRFNEVSRPDGLWDEI